MFSSTSAAFVRRCALELTRNANLSRHRLCCVACGVAGGGQRRRWPGVNQRQLSSVSSESARTNADLIVRSPFQDLPLQRDVSLAGHLLDDFGRYGDSPAVIDGATGERMSFAQLQSNIVRAGSALWRLGIRKGDVVAIFCENRPEFLVMYIAFAAIGAVISTVNPAYTVGELSSTLIQGKVKMLVASTSIIEVAKQAAKMANIPQKNIIVLGEADGCRPYSAIIQDDGKCFPDNLDWDTQEDIVVLPFSSGTTGKPKGVLISHHNLIMNIDQTRCVDVLNYTAGEDVLMGILPFFHIYGQTLVALAGLKNGACIVTLPAFSPELFLKTIKEYKTTYIHLVPPILLFLAKHPLVKVEDFPSVHSIMTAAAPCGANLMKEVRDRLGIPRIRQGFGLTEMSPLTHANPSENYRYDSSGFAVPNTEYKIVDVTTGEMLERRSEGELCIRGPQVMKGYLNNEEATRKTLIDGWLHTGDLGYADHDGHVVITDRLKELIKYKGLQVAPAELESLLLSHPAVADSAVIGIPDEWAGEVPKAYVVLRPNQQIGEEELKQFIAEQVAPFKQLRGGVEFRKEIPKSASGKILRRVLKEEFANANRQN